MVLKGDVFVLRKVKGIVEAVSHLLFPRQCIICEDELPDEVYSICSICYLNLQFTHFEKYTEPTDLDKLFWGRARIEATFALLFFKKKKGVQKVLHALKYSQRPLVGIEFGKIMGRKMKQMDVFSSVDLIVPVPLHSKKQFVRGYNQSMQLATGISGVLNIPVEEHFLAKRRDMGSQTKRSRFLRWDNVAANFMLKNKTKKAQHILVVDDVVTTGATIESLVHAIRENNSDLRVSIVSLAVTK